MQEKRKTKQIIKRNDIKENKAITLVALVVTVIVLIILAAVSISLVLGEHGLLKMARDGRDNYLVAANEEQAQLGQLEDQWDSLINGGNTPPPGGGGGNAPQPGESGYAGGSYNDPYIPIGFTHTGSENWNQGYTITGNADSSNPGDQFVWVPCSTEATPPEGVVAFTKITNSSSKYNSNNYILHPSGGTNAEVDPEDSTVGDIRTSVGTYGGFYIAKYEAGIEGTAANSTLGSNKKATDGGVKPKSQAGLGVWNSISRADCLTVAKAMIPVATGAKSTLISGECWDTALSWITATASENGDAAYAEDSSGKGWYSDVSSNAIHTTGYYGTNTKNIFDMGGNDFEYTSEYCSRDGFQYVVGRGGCYGNSGSDHPAAYRSYYERYADSYYSFRVVLYK